MADWDWSGVRTQCLREAEGVLGASGPAEDAAQEAAVRPSRTDPLEEVAEPAEESHEDDVLGQADIERAIAGLSGLDRQLVRGRYWDDLDYRQLGRLLDISEGTARVRLHRALARLRRRLVET